MKKSYLFLLLFFSITVFGQQIIVDTSSYTSTELTSLLLESSCIDFSNVSSSSSSSVAYFNANGSGFSLQEGIIIRNGNAQFTEGPYTGLNISTQINSNSDAELQQISSLTGQTGPITDVAFLQFDFISQSTDFNFNFLFASNEYGEWQCGFSDIFAFLITDLNTNTTTNLAIIPGTTTPVSVKDVRDTANNTSCPSVNPSFFDTYNVGNPNSIMNMRGYTQQMTASAVIQPNTPYRIRLVIGDYSDESYDSAVFIESGSFSNSFTLGNDVTLCSGNDYIIQSGLDFSQYTISWEKDGVPLVGENLPNLLVSTPGIYTIVAQKNGTQCILTDELQVFELQVIAPLDLSVCDNGTSSFVYNLLLNNASALGVNPVDFALVYYGSQSDLDAGTAIPSNQLNNFISSGNQTIFIKLLNIQTNSFCDTAYSFQLNVNSQLTLQDPDPISICNGGPVLINLNQVNSQIVSPATISNYQFTFFNSENDALSNTNPINNPSSFSLATGLTTATIYIRVAYATDLNCFGITSVTITVYDLPIVDALATVVACDSYILPALTNGNYFTQSGGFGTPLFAGDLIEDSDVLFIYSGPNAGNCFNESTFEIILLDDYTIPEDYCDVFIVPDPIEGDFYTEPGGPNGTGVQLQSNEVLTVSQIIYYYVEIDGVFCRDEPFVINIIPSPVVDQLSDVVTCDSYVLQPLQNGNYFTSQNGLGVPLFAGSVISATKTLYIYSENGICSSETSFTVTILKQPLPVNACGSYTLPSLPLGGYFDAPSGAGNSIPIGTEITSSQTVYWFAQTTTSNNCTSNYSIPITIYPIPEVSVLSDQLVCIDDPYVLPIIDFGNYFTSSNGGGIQLFPGDVITSTQTVYIYSETAFCSNQSNFVITVRALPLVSNLTDIFVCDPFILPVLQSGNYFTQPNGLGTALFAGDVIDTTQTIYIFNSYPDLQTCIAETSFTVNVLGVNLGSFTDLAVCDTYTLPNLSIGTYSSEPLGQGIQYQPGDIFTTTTTFYVYAQNGDRFFCDDQEEFTVTIYTTPVLPNLPNIDGCGEVVLPTLFPSGYIADYYSAANGIGLISPANYTFSQVGTYTIYVLAKSDVNATCFDEVSFEITVHPLPELILDNVFACIDLDTGDMLGTTSLSTGLNPVVYDANWYFNGVLVGTGLNYEATEIGLYTIETIRLTPELAPDDCNFAPTSIEIIPSSTAVAELVLSKPFEDNATITVTILDGLGSYMYQLDDGAFQTDPVFTDVSQGVHYVTIVDELAGCDALVLETIVIKYPNYFTPNGDGYNDTWSIKDLDQDKSAFISIYDRFGKLLKQFSPNKDSWDGMYNGIALPSTDYWFTVDFTYNGEPKVFKSHFTLKR